MPINSASGSTCTISLLQPNAIPNRLPCREYQYRSARDPATGAIQEIVTIESQNASPFEISLDIKPNTYLLNHPTTTITSTRKLNDCVYWAYLDGIEVGWTYSHGSGPHSMDFWRVFADDFSTYRALQFAPLNLVDPDAQDPDPDPDRSICEDKQVLNSLGIIRLDIFRCNLVLKPFRLEDHQDHVDYHLFKTTNQMGFSERSKKALLATTAGLTPHSTRSALPPPQSTWEVDEEDPHPFLQFIFNYKPRAILEAEGTIPRAPGPAGSSPQSRNIRYVDVDDDISIVMRKPTTKEEKKPNLRENPIEIKSDSESESESEGRDQKKKQDKQMNKRIKIDNKQMTKLDSESKNISISDQKTGVVDLQKPNFLDLTGSDNE